MRSRLGIFSTLVLLLAVTFASAQTPAPSPAPSAFVDHFARNQMEINSIWVAPDKTAFLAGRNAIYISTGDPMQWRAIDSLVATDFWQIAGGTPDNVFLTAHGPINSNTERLLAWTRDTGASTQVAMVPTNSCRFADDQRGAYIAEPMGRNGQWPESRHFNLRITTDGGKSWKLCENPLSAGGKDEELRSLQWTSADHLLIRGERSLAMFKVDGEGNLTRQWMTDTRKLLAKTSENRKPDAQQPAVWLDIEGHVVAINTTTGQALADINPGFAFNVIAPIGDQLWIAGDRNTAVYRADDTGEWALQRKFGYPGPSNSGHTDAQGHMMMDPPGGWVHWILADKAGAALLIGIDGQVYRWDGKADVLTATALAVDNTAVKNAQGVAAEKEPTTEQFREFMALSQTVPQNRLGDVMEARKAKQAAEHLTNRQAVAWTIDELKRIAAAPRIPAPATPPATGYFGSAVMDLRIFSPKSAVAITSLGILTTTGDLDHWKAVTPLPRQLFILIVGGSDKNLYMVSSEYREVVVNEGENPLPDHEHDPDLQRVTKRGKRVIVRNDYTFTLWHWTPAAGLVELRKLPRGVDYSSTPASCDFTNERLGAFVDGSKLMLTLDGAKTWIESPLELDKYARGVYQIVFCNDHQLAITSGSESIAMLQLDEQGHPHQLWHAPIFGRFGDRYSGVVNDPANKFLWVYSESPAGQGEELQAFGLADGKVIRSQHFEIGEGINSCSITGPRMYTLGYGRGGGTLLHIWDLTADPPKRLAEVTGEGSALDGAYAVPTTNDLYLLLGHERLIQWDGKPDVPAILPSSVHLPFIDHTLIDNCCNTIEMSPFWPH